MHEKRSKSRRVMLAVGQNGEIHVGYHGRKYYYYSPKNSKKNDLWKLKSPEGLR